MLDDASVWIRDPANRAVSVESLSTIAEICYILHLALNRIQTGVSSDVLLVEALKSFLESAAVEENTQVRYGVDNFELLSRLAAIHN